jgi:hypothetical protein
MDMRTRSDEIARSAILTVSRQGIVIDPGIIAKFFEAAARLAPNDAILSVDEQAEEDDYWQDAVITSVMEGQDNEQ